MKKKHTSHIRIDLLDKPVWKEYCKILGEPSPKLFSKLLKSKELNLNQRVFNEYKRKEMELKKKLSQI